MSDLQAKRDLAAKEIFGKSATYNALSAWSRMDIDMTIAKENAIVPATNLPEDSFNNRIAQLEDQLAVSKKENHDLWHENEALKMEIEARRDDDEDLHSRGTRSWEDTIGGES